MSLKTIYFPNLNAIRFIAVFLVIVHHIEAYRGMFSLSSRYQYPPIFNGGKLGVILFFVLSGFLITTLLSIEHKEKKQLQ
jgi:peptidoglycan/LPS O-acetylase OafA/YrhL